MRGGGAAASPREQRCSANPYSRYRFCSAPWEQLFRTANCNLNVHCTPGQGFDVHFPICLMTPRFTSPFVFCPKRKIPRGTVRAGTGTVHGSYGTVRGTRTVLVQSGGGVQYEYRTAIVRVLYSYEIRFFYLYEKVRHSCCTQLLPLAYSYEAGKMYGRFEVLCQCTEHGGPNTVFKCCFMFILTTSIRQ